MPNPPLLPSLWGHKPQYKATWRSTDARTENQIDHITINQWWRSSLQDVRVKRGASVGSGHHLVVGQLKHKLVATNKKKLKGPCSPAMHCPLQTETDRLMDC